VSIDFFHSILKSSEVNNKENLSNQENLLKTLFGTKFCIFIYLFILALFFCVHSCNAGRHFVQLSEVHDGSQASAKKL